MLVRLSPHPDQLRWYLESALNGFETLDLPHAIEHATADVREFLAYLDRTNNAVLETGVEAVKPGVWRELGVRYDHTPNYL